MKFVVGFAVFVIAFAQVAWTELPPPVCEMPRCPPTCGFSTDSNGCRQCDCSIPRGPIKEKPCVKECPQDCGQTVGLDGCLECECGAEPFFGDKIPMPIE